MPDFFQTGRSSEFRNMFLRWHSRHWPEHFSAAAAVLRDYSPSQRSPQKNDPAIIGYGKVVFDKEMDKYEKFTLNIEYRSDRTPKYVAIVTSSSALGDYFTGGTGSVLYLDEFKFLY